MTAEEIQVRRDICADCRRECAVRATIAHADPCVGCPHGVYGVHSDCDPEAPEPMRGLGDVVAAVAQHIARVIDRATGGRTRIANCGGCKARQSALNKAFPFDKPPT